MSLFSQWCPFIWMHLGNILTFCIVTCLLTAILLIVSPMHPETRHIYHLDTHSNKKQRAQQLNSPEREWREFLPFPDPHSWN